MRLFLSFGKRLSDQPRGDLFEHNKQINKDLDGNCFLFVKGLKFRPCGFAQSRNGITSHGEKKVPSGESVYGKKRLIDVIYQDYRIDYSLALVIYAQIT